MEYSDAEFDSERVFQEARERAIVRVAEVLLVAALSAACLLLLAYPPDRGARRQDTPTQILWQVPSTPAPTDVWGYQPTFTRASMDYGKEERYKSAPLRVAPYPLLQTAKFGGAVIFVTVFVAPSSTLRHLRVEWVYSNGEAGAAERDLDGESPVEFPPWVIRRIPSGDIHIIATVRQRFADGRIGKVLHRVERKAIVAGSE